MDGIRVFCDDGYDTCKRLIEATRQAAQESFRRVVVCIELRCKVTLVNNLLESRKMFVGPIENDSIISVKIGDRIKITTDESVLGSKSCIAVRNCAQFNESLIE